jgi:F-box protein 21
MNSYAASVRQAYPGIDDFTPRRKASVIVDHLLAKKWIGIQDGRHYHSLDHMFLGVSLFSSNRNSIPLIAAIIFCYVARQFNLRAVPCSYPFHVHALVQPPTGCDLDGNVIPENTDDQPSKATHLYMDPFNSSEPISLAKLEMQLNYIAPNAPLSQRTSYLSAATPRELSIRAAHNILSSPSHDPGPTLFPINPNLATYAALFALVILSSSPTAHPAQIRQHLAVLTQHFLEYFDLDIHLFETYVLPFTHTLPDSRAYRNLLSQLKQSDQETRLPKYHSEPKNAAVEFSVGQIFRHRRRGYLAVIYGWDPYCRMQEHWITMNQVDRLPKGRNQPFYNVLVEDESTRYVAQENVVLLEPDEITEEHVNVFPIEIGKWFKRFDRASATFVSNVRAEYPED